MEVEMNETQALVDQYIDENKTDDALNLLCKTAIDLARNQRFDEAETCRDRLYEVDSTALSAIIKDNEVIENEKSRAISTDFRQTWAHILEPLTAEEAYALNSALKSVHLPPDHAVIERGRANNRLFFCQQWPAKDVVPNWRQGHSVKKHGDGGNLRTGDLFLHQCLYAYDHDLVSRRVKLFRKKEAGCVAGEIPSPLFQSGKNSMQSRTQDRPRLSKLQRHRAQEP
jgi:hypothetical protein